MNYTIKDNVLTLNIENNGFAFKIEKPLNFYFPCTNGREEWTVLAVDELMNDIFVYLEELSKDMTNWYHEEEWDNIYNRLFDDLLYIAEEKYDIEKREHDEEDEYRRNFLTHQ